MKSIFTKLSVIAAALITLTFTGCSLMFGSYVSNVTCETESGLIRRGTYNYYIEGNYDLNNVTYKDAVKMKRICEEKNVGSIDVQSGISKTAVRSFLYQYYEFEEVSEFMMKINNGDNIILFFETNDPELYMWYYIEGNRN